jgi:serine/threonine protein kinase
MFDKGKRDQLIREINALYNAQCDSLIRFYGAFYREGAITIALEYMDGGSLTNVLHQVLYHNLHSIACTQ